MQFYQFYYVLLKEMDRESNRGLKRSQESASFIKGYQLRRGGGDERKIVSEVSPETPLMGERGSPGPPLLILRVGDQ